MYDYDGEQYDRECNGWLSCPSLDESEYSEDED